MFRYLILTATFSSFLLLNIPAVNSSEEIPDVKIQPPSFITIEEAKSNEESKINIKGTTARNTNVLIYLDGSYQSSATVEKKYGNKYIFTDTVFGNIEPGKHVLTAISQNKNSKRLSPPTSYGFKVTPKLADKEKQDKKTDLQTPSDQTHAVVPTPTVIAPSKNNAVFCSPPTIKGFTLSGTRIHIFINGQLYKKTAYLNNSSGTAYFEYTPSEEMEKGEYNIQVMAENKENVKSKRSNSLSFFLLDSLSTTITPVITTPDKHEKVNKNNLIIEGSAKSGSIINLYIDNILIQSITNFDDNSLSDKTNFSFSPDITLQRGAHSAYIKSIDPVTNLTTSSEKVSFNVVDPKIASSTNSIDQTRKEEREEEKEKSKEDKKAEKTDPTSTEKIKDGKEAGFTKEFLSYFILAAIIIFIVSWLAWVNKANTKEE